MLKKLKSPFNKLSKGKPKILHYESEHVINIIDSYKKVRLRALEKEQETAEIVG